MTELKGRVICLERPYLTLLAADGTTLRLLVTEATYLRALDDHMNGRDTEIAVAVGAQALLLQPDPA